MTKYLNNLYNQTFSILVVFILFGAILYAPVLDAPFKMLDDNISIVQNDLIKDVANAPQLFKQSFFGSGHFYRPLVSLSFMLDHHFFGMQSLYFNIINLMLHICCAFMVFLVISILLENRKYGFWTGFLFLVHPINWEPVCNIPGRSILLCTFFTLSALYFLLLAFKYNKSYIHIISSLLCFILAMLSKESAAMMPVLAGSYLLIIKRVKLKELLVLVPYFIVIGIYIAVRTYFDITETFPWQGFGAAALGFLTFLRSVLTHLRLFILPVDLYFDRSRLLYEGFLNVSIWVAPVVLVSVAGFLWRIRQRVSAVVWFFILWCAIEIFPVSQLVTNIGVHAGAISAADHFLYVPSIGLFALLVLWVDRIAFHNEKMKIIAPSIFMVVTTAVLSMWMVMTSKQAFISNSALTMYKQSIDTNPNNARMRYALGYEWVKVKHFKNAEKHFRAGLALDSGDTNLRMGLAQSLCDQRRTFSCVRAYERAAVDVGLEVKYKENLHQAYLTLIEHYKIVLTTEPNQEGLYYNLAITESKAGFLEDALTSYLKAITLKPDFRMALFNVATLYEAQQDFKKAAQYYELSLGVADIHDEHTEYANLRLIDIYSRLNMPKRANKHR
ncbi:MAG: tetratricopeptide (TPR) repeat protein [Lysobacterales bacterium]|jgi:tetratricopeptide (TPR) repeat protein